MFFGLFCVDLCVHASGACVVCLKMTLAEAKGMFVGKNVGYGSLIGNAYFHFRLLQQVSLESRTAVH